MRGADQLHAALGDRARRGRLELRADLVDDDDLGHVVLDRLDHHARAAAAGVRTCIRRARPMPGCGMSPSPAISLDVSTTTTRLSSSSASTRAASRSIVVLPMPGRPMISTLLPGLDQVLDDLDRAEHGAADPRSQADDLAAPIADGRDAVQGALDAGAVVLAERADVVDDVLDVLVADLAIEQHLFAARGPKRASGRRPRSMTISITSRSAGIARTRSAISGGSATRSASRSEGRSSVRASVMCVMLPSFSEIGQRRTAGTSAGFLTRSATSFISSETLAVSAKPCSSKRRSSGAS